MCAFYGAQISTNVRVAQVLDGTIYVQQAAAKTAHQTYCDQRAAHGLADIDGCGASERYAAVAPDRVHVDANDDLSRERRRCTEISRYSNPYRPKRWILLFNPHATRGCPNYASILPLLAQQRTLPSVAPMTRLERGGLSASLGWRRIHSDDLRRPIFRRSNRKSAEIVGEGSARPERIHPL